MELNTRASYVSHFNVSLEPQFGSTQLGKITGPMVQSWVSQMVDEGVNPSTAVARYKALQTILAAERGSSAIRDGYIAANPCHGATLPAAPAREPQIYTTHEAGQVIAALPEWWRLLPLLASELGIRWGVALGLTVQDFTPDYRRVRIQRTVIEGAIENMGGPR